MDKARLVVRIEGETGAINADTLVAVLQRTLGVLREIDRTSRQGGDPRGHWRVGEVRNGSIGVALVPSEDVFPEVAEKLVAGLAVLEARPELPPWFSEPAIKKVQQMGKFLGDPGVSGIGLIATGPSGARIEARVTPEIIEHAAQAFQGTDEALGSVAGVLDVVNLRRGQHTVSLYDAGERHAVRCTFPEDLFEAVRRHLGSKVRASGTITRNRAGQVVSVRIDSLDHIEEGGPVPSVAELAGIAPWYTGERNAVEHQQWTRGA